MFRSSLQAGNAVQFSCTLTFYATKQTGFYVGLVQTSSLMVARKRL